MPTRTASNRRPKNSHRRLARRKQARRQRTALAELLESRDAAGSMLLSLPGFISLSPLTSGTARASLADAVADATGGQHKANAKPYFPEDTRRTCTRTMSGSRACRIGSGAPLISRGRLARRMRGFTLLGLRLAPGHR